MDEMVDRDDIPEITPEMIEAGIECVDRGPLSGSGVSRELLELAVRKIYSAMVLARGSQR